MLAFFTKSLCQNHSGRPWIQTFPQHLLKHSKQRNCADGAASSPSHTYAPIHPFLPITLLTHVQVDLTSGSFVPEHLSKHFISMSTGFLSCELSTLSWTLRSSGFYDNICVQKAAARILLLSFSVKNQKAEGAMSQLLVIETSDIRRCFLGLDLISCCSVHPESLCQSKTLGVQSLTHLITLWL